MNIYRGLLLLAGLLLPPRLAAAATVLFCPFDSLEGWSVRTVGAAKVTVGGAASATPYADIACQGGTALLSRELPLEAVQGCRILLNCVAKSEAVTRGPQLCSTAKVHLAVRTPRGIEHHHARLAGSSDWHQEAFVADIPRDAQQVLLNLGLEGCHGRASFRRLLLQNNRRGVYPLSLAETANADHAQLELGTFPKETVQWQGIPFTILQPPACDGADCIRLRGADHADWPLRTTAAIQVRVPATTIYILHGAINGREHSDSPCAIWTARFCDGQEISLSVFEGREIGAIGAADDLENWRVAWREQTPQGKWVSFGVTKWTLHYNAPVAGLSCRAYQGAAPLVIAVTAVEEPTTTRLKTPAEEADEEI